MIRSQLQSIKEGRRAIHAQMKRRAVFGDTEDLDDETVLEMIPIQTQFTAPKSLRFDRQRQTKEEEERFNKRFSAFLKGLVRHAETRGIEYLLDYLVRRYMCDHFNQREMIFVLLPFKKYYSHVLSLSSASEFNYFVVQQTHSHQFIGNLCLKDKYFFDFFVEYFEYFGHVREFCTEVFKHISAGLRGTDKDFSMQFFEVISHLVRCGERLFALEVFLVVRDHVREAAESFIEILEPFFSRDFLQRTHEEPRTAESVPHDESLLFRREYEKGEDRRFLEDPRLYRAYVVWLSREGLPLKSVDSREFVVLKMLCGLSRNEHLDGGIEDYFRIFAELAETDDLIKLLDRAFPGDIHLLIPHMKDSDKVYLSGIHPALFERLITETNHVGVARSVPRKFLKERIVEFMRICIGYIGYDFSPFLCHVDENVVLALMKDCCDDVHVQNIIATSRAAGIDLGARIVEHGLYRHSGYLSHLSECAGELNLETSRRIFEEVSGSPSEAGAAALCRYFHRVEDDALVNLAVGWLAGRMRLSPMLCSLLRRHVERLSRESCEMILEMTNVAEDVYFVLDRLYSIRRDVVDECLGEGHYNALLFLCRRHGFSNVLGDRKSLDVVEVVKLASECALTAEETQDLVSHASTLILLGGSDIINLMLKDEYIPCLMRCSRLEGWKIIKVVLSEAIQQNSRRSQWCFDYFVDNHADFAEDADLLSVIVRNEVVVDDERLLGMFSQASGFLRAECAEILLENTLFSPLKFIPLIVPAMIEHRKQSLGMLFKRCGNIMGIYVKDVLTRFPEIWDEMLGLDARYLLVGAVKAYREQMDAGCLEFLHKVFETSRDVSPAMFELVARFLNEHISDVGDELLIRFVGFYLETCKSNADFIQDLLESIYRARMGVFFEVANSGFQHCHALFTPYADGLVEMMESGDRNAIVFIMNYLYWDADYEVPHSKLFKMLFELYCTTPDGVYARCIASILRHNPETIEPANNLILDRMRGNDIVMLLELLQVLYRKVYEFKRCLKRSSPHFALVVDSTRKDVAKAARKLLEIIERKHKKSGYQVLQL